MTETLTETLNLKNGGNTFTHIELATKIGKFVENWLGLAEKEMSLTSKFEVFVFTDVDLDEVKQTLVQMGFTREVEGDYPHHTELDVCAVAFANKGTSHSQQTRVTLGANVGEVVPQAILLQLQELIPDVEMVDVLDQPLQI